MTTDDAIQEKGYSGDEDDKGGKLTGHVWLCVCCSWVKKGVYLRV